MRKRLTSRIGAIFLPFLMAAAANAHGPERLLIDGSTGVMPLAASLAKAFGELHPKVGIEMGAGLGTNARIAALADGRIDVALASHGIDIDDLNRRGMKVYEIARVAVVFGVNSTVSVANLTDLQICDVYKGLTTSWKALGGAEMAIAARTRPDSEVDTEVVRAHIDCLRDLRMADGVKVMAKGGDMARELGATPGAIGMTTMTAVEQSQGRIRPVSLNGIAPDPASVNRKSYRLVRESYFVVRDPPSPAVAGFIEFSRGPAGAQVISANGALPVK